MPVLPVLTVVQCRPKRGRESDMSLRRSAATTGSEREGTETGPSAIRTPLAPRHPTAGPALERSEGGSASLRRYHCTLIRAGYVDAADGTQTNWLIPAHVLERDAPLFDGAPCYLDHPDMQGFWPGEPKVRNLAGIFENVYYQPDSQSINGTLRIYDDHPQAQAPSQAHSRSDPRRQVAGRAVPGVAVGRLYHKAETDEQTGARLPVSSSRSNRSTLSIAQAQAGTYPGSSSRPAPNCPTPKTQKGATQWNQRNLRSSTLRRPLITAEGHADACPGGYPRALPMTQEEVPAIRKVSCQVEQLHRRMDDPPRIWGRSPSAPTRQPRRSKISRPSSTPAACRRQRRSLTPSAAWAGPRD
jgi:hypothetical protein